MARCGGGKQSTEDLIIVDVTKSYPKKELILQDFMEVEYIPLETTDEFLTQGLVMTVGKEIILIENRVNDGDIFIFDRNGKALRKINRKGQGGEEYIYINQIVLDENNNELFVNTEKKILVYNLYGKFKRSIKYPDKANYANICNYDKDHLICYDSSVNNRDGEERGSQAFHVIISKQDGSITREIFLPFKTIKTHKIYKDEYVIVSTSEGYSISPYQNNWILVELSSDTIYKYAPNGQLTPLIVRTPSIQSMDTEVFLFPKNFTDRYCFMETMKKKVDFETMKGFPRTDLMYDWQEKAIFEYTVYNDDYSNKTQVPMRTPINDEIASWQILEAHRLVEAYTEGQLKDGKLKEIAAKLEEEDNPVIMLVKYKQ